MLVSLQKQSQSNCAILLFIRSEHFSSIKSSKFTKTNVISTILYNVLNYELFYHLIHYHISTILDIIIIQVQDFPFLPSSVHYYCDLKSVDALCICVASKTRSPIVRLLNYLLNRPAVDIHFDEILIYNNLFTISVYFWGSGPLINRF